MLFRFIVRRLYLIVYIWYKHFWRIMIASLGVFITLLFVFLFLGIVTPFKKKIIQDFENNLPTEIIKFIPKQVGEYTTPLFFLDNKDIRYGIDKNKLKKILTLDDIEWVEKSQILQKVVLASLRHPALDNLGGALRFDILVQGISPNLVKPYLFCMKNFEPKIEFNKDNQKKIIIPLVVPKNYLDIARLWLSLNNLPSVDLYKMRALELELSIGSSMLKGTSNNSLTVYGKICGFLPEGIVTTLGIPLNWVENYHKANLMPLAANSYDQIFIKLKNIASINSIQKDLRQLSLVRAGGYKKYGDFYQWLQTLDYIFYVFVFLLCVVSIISLVNSFSLLAFEKKYEFGLYMLFGASPYFIMLLMFLEGFLWGLLYAIVALLCSNVLFSILQTNTPKILSNLVFAIDKQEQYTLIFIASLVSALSSLVPVILLMYKKTLLLIKKD